MFRAYNAPILSTIYNAHTISHRQTFKMFLNCDVIPWLSQHYHFLPHLNDTLCPKYIMLSSSIKPKWMSAIVRVPNGKHYFYIPFNILSNQIKTLSLTLLPTYWSKIVQLYIAKSKIYPFRWLNFVVQLAQITVMLVSKEKTSSTREL